MIVFVTGSIFISIGEISSGSGSIPFFSLAFIGDGDEGGAWLSNVCPPRPSPRLAGRGGRTQKVAFVLLPRLSRRRSWRSYMDFSERGEQGVPVGFGRFPAGAEAHGTHGLRGLESHGAQHMRRFFLAGGAGGTGAHGKSRLVEADDPLMLAVAVGPDGERRCSTNAAGSRRRCWLSGSVRRN